ncbi:hypothetical protein F5X96DRAFT_674714 [Biscogniauxia mediterranea]|nr:hypothetical protein F5X96DRAFT_674714 [Biscogniauxia mediterranea]
MTLLPSLSTLYLPSFLAREKSGGTSISEVILEPSFLPDQDSDHLEEAEQTSEQGRTIPSLLNDCQHSRSLSLSSEPGQPRAIHRPTLISLFLNKGAFPQSESFSFLHSRSFSVPNIKIVASPPKTTYSEAPPKKTNYSEAVPQPNPETHLPPPTMPSYSSSRRGPKKQGRRVRATKLNPEAPEFTTQGIMFSSPLTQPQSGQDSVLASPSPGAATVSSPELAANYKLQSYDYFRQTEYVDSMSDHNYQHGRRHSSLSNLLEFPQQEEEREEPRPSQVRRATTGDSDPAHWVAAPLGSSSPAQAQAQECEKRKKKLEEKRKIRDAKAPLEKHQDIEEDARGFSDDDEFYPGADWE